MKRRFWPAFFVLLNALAIAAPARAVDVTDLWNELNSGSSLVFKQKYLGKPITVTGKTWVIQGEAVPYYVSLTGENMVGTLLICTVNSTSVLLPLKKGQALTVSGTMQSVGLAGINLQPCAIRQ